MVLGRTLFLAIINSISIPSMKRLGRCILFPNASIQAFISFSNPVPLLVHVHGLLTHVARVIVQSALRGAAEF